MQLYELGRHDYETGSAIHDCAIGLHRASKLVDYAASHIMCQEIVTKVHTEL